MAQLSPLLLLLAFRRCGTKKKKLCRPVSSREQTSGWRHGSAAGRADAKVGKVFQQIHSTSAGGTGLQFLGRVRLRSCYCKERRRSRSGPLHGSSAASNAAESYGIFLIKKLNFFSRVCKSPRFCDAVDILMNFKTPVAFVAFLEIVRCVSVGRHPHVELRL